MDPTQPCEVEPSELKQQGISMAKYVERFGGYGQVCNLALIQWQVCLAMDQALAGHMEGCLDILSLLCVCLQQASLDNGNLDIGYQAETGRATTPQKRLEAIHRRHCRREGQTSSGQSLLLFLPLSLCLRFLSFPASLLLGPRCRWRVGESICPLLGYEIQFPKIGQRCSDPSLIGQRGKSPCPPPYGHYAPVAHYCRRRLFLQG